MPTYTVDRNRGLRCRRWGVMMLIGMCGGETGGLRAINQSILDETRRERFLIITIDGEIFSRSGIVMLFEDVWTWR